MRKKLHCYITYLLYKHIISDADGSGHLGQKNKNENGIIRGMETELCGTKIGFD